MKSSALIVRLQPHEWEILRRLCGGAVKRNPSELVRFWLHREHNRLTTRRSVVADKDVSTDWRNGRPRRAKPQPV